MENQVALAQTREFTVGSVLSRTLDMFKQKFGLYYGLAIIAQIVPLIFLIIVMFIAPNSIALLLLAMLLMVIFGLVMQGAVVYAVYQSLRNDVVSIGDAISKAMSNIVPLFLIAIVCGIAIGIGFMILVIPGLIIMTMVAVVIPVCMAERLGTMDAIKRSTDLTKGYRLKVFALLLIVLVASAIINGIINGIVGAIVPNVIVVSVVSVAIGAVPMAFGYIMASVMYYDLRAVKEGISVDALADVFE